MRVGDPARYLYWAASFKLRLRVRQRRAADRIKTSGLFDKDYYVLWNPDVDPAFVDPVDHYVMRGADEGRDPHPLFSTEFYRSQYPDVGRRGVNPFDHWMQVGVREGRSPHPVLTESSGRRSGRKSPVSEAKIILSGGTDRRLLVLRAETVRREKERSSSGGSLFRSCTFFAYQNQPARLESATWKPRTILALTHELPERSGAQGQSAQWQLLEHFENAGDRVVLVYCMLPGQVGTDLIVEKAAADRRNFIAISGDGDVRMKLEKFFLDFQERLVLGPIASNLLRKEALLSDRSIAEGDQVHGSGPFLEVLARFADWMPEPFAVLMDSLGQASLLTSIPGRSLKLLDVRQEPVSSFERAFSETLEEGESGSHERKAISCADQILADLEQVQGLEAFVSADKIVVLGPDFSGVPMLRSSVQDVSDTAPVLLVASKSLEFAADLKEFLRFVWPLVLETHPGSRLCISGLPVDAVPAGILGLSMASASDLLSEQYGEARLVVNASKRGVGVVARSLEALASGCPVVTWPAGVYGLPPQVSRYCSVASDVYEFASKIRSFLDERIDSQRAVAARQAVGDYFSEDRSYRSLEKTVAQFFEESWDGENSASGFDVF